MFHIKTIAEIYLCFISAVYLQFSFVIFAPFEATFTFWSPFKPLLYYLWAYSWVKRMAYFQNWLFGPICICTSLVFHTLLSWHRNYFQYWFAWYVHFNEDPCKVKSPREPALSSSIKHFYSLTFGHMSYDYCSLNALTQSCSPGVPKCFRPQLSKQPTIIIITWRNILDST